MSEERPENVDVKPNKLKHLLAGLRTLWHDPVWSKVIATIIVGVFGVFGVYFLGTPERETIRPFEQNSAYSVLVFHKPEQQTTASALADALLSTGFKSSATSTYLTEANRKFKPNEAWVIYTLRGKEKLPDVKKILMATAPNVHYIEEPQPSNLQRGDIQILLF